MDNNNNEEVPSAPSTPVTPGTPGAPLFGGFKPDHRSSGIGRKSLLKSCSKCLTVDDWALEEGALPKAFCALPPPPVSLARKVYIRAPEFESPLTFVVVRILVALVIETIYTTHSIPEFKSLLASISCYIMPS